MKAHYIDKLAEVMKRINSSFFFYDLDALNEHLSKMASIAHQDVKLWYACKANPISSILKVLRNLGFGIDVASKGELFQALNSGISADHILATGPAKSKAYLRHLLKRGVKTIVLESINQALWLNDAAAKLGVKPDALLRVQLDWPDGESVLGGNRVTPFGLGTRDWLALEPNKLSHINLRGFHVFQWGNILDVNLLEKIWNRSILEIKELANSLTVSCEILDLGGGLGIPYQDDSDSIDFKLVHDLLLDLKDKHHLQKIWLELGRYSVGNAGYYFTKVVDRKSVRNKNLLVVEGGINHLARPALTKQSFPCRSFRESDAPKIETIIHGPLCTALDFLGSFMLPNDIDVDDWLVFSQAGAYGFTESMPYFLCHSLAGEVTYYKGDMMIPRPPKNSFEWLI